MKRNNFNLSHYKTGTMPFGRLVPISCYEVLPGDTIQMASSIFFRLSPLVNPSFAVLRAKWWTFFVPNRLLWSKWENFRTGGPDGLDVSVPPKSVFSSSTAGSLADYLGIPPGYNGEVSLFPFRAYYKIWSEYFRDQDLFPLDRFNSTATARYLSDDDYPINSYNIVAADAQPLPYAWEKDYFTTCRPWPQKGAEVSVPVDTPAGGTTTLNIVPSGNGIPTFDTDEVQYNPNVNPNSFLDGANLRLSSDSNGYIAYGRSNGDNDPSRFTLKWSDPKLTATINNTSEGGIGSVRLDALREAFALQRFEEARAMYGSRYTEYLRYLGVKSSDARLQRPEYLGGGKATIQISEVLQTASDGNTPVGTLRGHGIGASRSRRFRRFIEEDGIVMTLCSVMPLTLYSQGVSRMFSREVKEDYWTRELEHIGQQEVYTKELYGSVNDKNTVFGYQNRYDDYRSVPSSVCGQMRPGEIDEDWTMARVFSNEPVLNDSFIYGTPTLRNFAEQTTHPIYFMAQHSVVAKRLMSKTGNPIL